MSPLRALRSMSLAQRFRLANLAVGVWSGDQLERSIVDRTGSVTALYVESIIEPSVASMADGGELSSEGVATLDTRVIPLSTSSRSNEPRPMRHHIRPTLGREALSEHRYVDQAIGELRDIGHDSAPLATLPATTGPAWRGAGCLVGADDASVMPTRLAWRSRPSHHLAIVCLSWQPGLRPTSRPSCAIPAR